MTEREKVIRGLECCITGDPDGSRECKKCPYRRKGITNEPCFNALHADALVLLKAPEARVMTQEEVLATPEGVVVWMEENSESGNYIQPIVSTGNGCLGNFYLGVGVFGVEYSSRRFWTSRPTEQQIRDTKWEVTDNG